MKAVARGLSVAEGTHSHSQHEDTEIAVLLLIAIGIK